MKTSIIERNKIRAVRGIPAILPEQAKIHHWILGHWHQLMQQYSYEEILLPVLELSPLFVRAAGGDTDWVVQKELFRFQDLDGEELCLRPEGTASCVRLGIEHSLFYGQTPRLWYHGPMFRRERPQKGRHRQFYQIGLEAFGVKSNFLEAEQLLLLQDFWHLLGIKPVLELNCIGTNEERQIYAAKLREYFAKYQSELPLVEQQRLENNPLRILDSKDPAVQNLVSEAPLLSSVVDQKLMEQILSILNEYKIAYTFNPYLVRGLDYYNGLVFEWKHEQGLGSQSTIAAGGRYDGLVAELGGRDTPACGFAMGVDRIALLCQEILLTKPIVAIVAVEFANFESCLRLSHDLKSQLSQLGFMLCLNEGKLKARMQQAVRAKAQFALILGSEEDEKQKVQLRDLRSGVQEEVAFTDLATRLAAAYTQIG